MVGRRPANKHGRRVRKPSVPAGAAAGLTSQVTTPHSDPAGNSLVLVAEIDIAGSVYIDARVRLEGVVDGEIRCTELEITPQARVRGRIVAERVTIYGAVSEGSIYANVLILKPGCSVEAEIYHEHLQLDQGSYFDGKSRRVTDPTALAPL